MLTNNQIKSWHVYVLVLPHQFISHLQEAELVGNVESIVVVGELDVSLLQAVRSDQSVDSVDLDVVELLSRSLYLLLVGGQRDDEHKGVTVLNILHGSLSGQRILDNIESLGSLDLGVGLDSYLGVSSKLKSVRLVEVNLGVNSGGLSAIALLESSSDLLGGTLT